MERSETAARRERGHDSRALQGLADEPSIGNTSVVGRHRSTMGLSQRVGALPRLDCRVFGRCQPVGHRL